MSSCHENHLTDWSGLYLLADTAIMVDEEEKRHLREEKEEEESKKRFFSLYPRKIRSSLVKRRDTTQQNLKAVSTSSSTLLDLNLIPTDDYETENLQNPSSESMVCDEEESRKKGKSKIVCEEDDKEESDEKKVFEKNLKRFVAGSRRYTQQNSENLNGASTSSTLLNLRCSKPSLLLYYNTAESEKRETKDPPNPNHQSSSLCRKRRAVQQRKRTGGFKKAKIDPPLPRMVTETPEWIFRVMKNMKSDAENPRLVFERNLSASDVKSDLSRLLIPFKQLIRDDFLTRAEYLAIHNNQEDEENIGVGTLLVNQRSEMWGLRFKVWAMEKESGNGTLNYILNWGWNDVVKGNDLKVDDKISLWTFRFRGVLCFALDTVNL